MLTAAKSWSQADGRQVPSRSNLRQARQTEAVSAPASCRVVFRGGARCSSEFFLWGRRYHLQVTTGCGDPEKESGMPAEDVTAEIHGFSEPDSTPTPWAVGLEQVHASDTFWLTTVRPDGRPHVTPLIAVWHSEALWFATGPEERKARNLAENQSCVLTTGNSDWARAHLTSCLKVSPSM
jgi:Pyridoxamine 5'-phosphate oxidase